MYLLSSACLGGWGRAQTCVISVETVALLRSEEFLDRQARAFTFADYILEFPSLLGRATGVGAKNMRELRGGSWVIIGAKLSLAVLFSSTAQVGSGVVRGGPEVRFHEGFTRVPRGFHQGSTRVPRGSARATGWCEH